MTQVRVPIEGLDRAIHDQLETGRTRARERANGGHDA
jgi:hypothetical protein